MLQHFTIKTTTVMKKINEKVSEVIFYTLEKSIKAYRRFAQQEISKQGYDLTIDQWLVLRSLQENKQLSQKQIAEVLFKDFASITRIIEILVQKEYVVRRISTGDRRTFELEITDAGDKIIEAIYPIVIKNRKQALKNISPDDVQHLKTQLETLITNCTEPL